MAGAFAAPLSAQQPVDSVARLPAIVVTATRSDLAGDRVPLAVGVVEAPLLGRARMTTGLDEFLTTIPGVHVADRFNPSLDQRLSIRGAGSRSNFGTRGVKVLLDGVPQTLPDGQSQLTNVEFDAIGRVEVIRGPTSALYGNASGGVVSLSSVAVPESALALRARAEGGGFGLFKWHATASTRGTRTAAALDVSRLEQDGFREHSATRATQVGGVVQRTLGPGALLTVRGTWTDIPQADNPGALTQAEMDANPAGAAPNNLARNAGKDVTQGQLSARLQLTGTNGSGAELVAYGMTRRLDNPLATNTWVEIDRLVGGLRASAFRRLGGAGAPRLTAGFDVQRMRDDRRNTQTLNGGPSDSVLLDQRETVTELGPFAQLTWSTGRLTLLGGVRYDRVVFDVADNHLSDGADNSGQRPMPALSGQAGASLALSDALVPYVSIGTSFETPTTTELVNQPGAAGGFNDQLNPQRTVSAELGARGRKGLASYSLAAYRGRVSDAIVPYQEVGGRSYFTNAGRLNADGVEAGLALARARWGVAAAYTYARYRFAEYLLVRGAVTDTLSGNTVPAVPEHFLRLSARISPLRNLWIDADQTLSSSLFADDANSIAVAGWGAGLSNVRVSWMIQAGRWLLTPFGGVNNLAGRRYVASVTVNGANGRVFEPGAGRTAWLGLEAGINR